MNQFIYKSKIKTPTPTTDPILEDYELYHDLLCTVCRSFPENGTQCRKCNSIICMDCQRNDNMSVNIQKCNQCVYESLDVSQIQRLHKTTLECPLKCNEQISAYSYKTHLRDQCINQPIECSCGSVVVRYYLDHHIANCIDRDITCFKCKGVFKKYQESNHDCIIVLQQQIKHQTELINEIKADIQLSQKEQSDFITAVTNQMATIDARLNHYFQHCSNGHQLFWQVSMIGVCHQCNTTQSLRQLCYICQQGYCCSCKPPTIRNRRCPQAHYLEVLEPPFDGNRFCDHCGKRFTEGSVNCLADQLCDFDLCSICFEDHYMKK